MSKWIFPALKPKKGFQSSPQTKAGKVETHQKCYPSSKVKGRGFPAGSTEKNPPANAKDIGLIPGLGRSHMLQLLKPATREATTMRSCAPQLERSPRSSKDPEGTKINKKVKGESDCRNCFPESHRQCSETPSVICI